MNYWYFFINTGVEVAALLASFYYFKRRKNFKGKLLFILLAITVVVEVTAIYPLLIENNGPLAFLKDSNFEQNYWMYNIFVPLSTLVYVYLFKREITTNIIGKALSVGLAVFVVITVIEAFFSATFFVQFMPVTQIASALLTILSIAFYYLELFKSEKILHFHKSLIFYVSVGLLIFTICTTPLFIYSYFFTTRYNPNFVNLYMIILATSIVIMYSCFTFGFILCARQKDNF